jgi:hypothetical protein
MELLRKITLIIYRFRERGLEIFLMEREDINELSLPNEQKLTSLPEKFTAQATLISMHENEETWALEMDEEDIPSLKELLYEDALNISEKIITYESGTYFRVKEALKKVMPQQYKWIKELKDVLLDRNSVRDM